MTVHDFTTSKNSDDAEWWDDVYRRFFRDYDHHEVVTSREEQLAGIDHRVHMTGGAVVLVDAKVRDDFYDDFLIEVHSVQATRSPGWVRKPLHCHYIAYAFPNQLHCYMIPFHVLQRAYEQNKHRWAADPSRFPTKGAKNTNYTTLSVAVPREELMSACIGAQLVYFEDDAEPFKPETWRLA